MQSIFDFLGFRLLISPAIFFIVYYIGALILPVGSWLIVSRIKQKYWVVSGDNVSTSETINDTSHKNRNRIVILFITLFICLEVFWRMFIEFLMAYFQIRDALLILAT